MSTNQQISNHPVILAMKLNRSYYVTQLCPIDKSIDSWEKIRDYEILNPLPSNLEKTTTKTKRFLTVFMATMKRQERNRRGIIIMMMMRILTRKRKENS